MIKKIINIVIIIILALIAINFCKAQDTTTNWIINNFHADITIDKNASINVKETIDVDFYTNQKHGIYRNIPVKYKDKYNQNLKLHFKVNSVKDNNGNNYNYEISSSGNDKVIKIGDPDKLVSSKNTYIIDYEVKNAVTYFSDHDELYWNVTGLEWPVIIENALATVNLPGEISKDKLQAKLFTGIYGSQDENGTIDTTDSRITYKTNQELNPGQGLTIVSGWPPGIVHKPTFWEKFWQILTANLFYFLPIVVFFILLYLYFKHGRDPKGRGTIVPEFAVPKGLTPLEIGAIVDEKVDDRDISASIIDLAIRKYLQINVKKVKGIFGNKDEIILKKLKSPDDSINDFEKELIDGIFDRKEEIALKDVKDFYISSVAIKNQVYAKMTRDGYFPKHPHNTKIIYLTIGIIVFAIGIFAYFGNISFNVGMVLSGILFMIFAPFMPKKTPVGVALKEKILGLKLYLQTAERYRLKFQENQQIFEKFLPAAIALGVAGIWAQKFKNIYRDHSPYWYHGYPGYIYVPTALASGFNSMQSQVSHMSSSSSGGSGFSGGGSGGGFGGGGGGSW